MNCLVSALETTDVDNEQNTNAVLLNYHMAAVSQTKWTIKHSSGTTGAKTLVVYLYYYYYYQNMLQYAIRIEISCYAMLPV